MTRTAILSDIHGNLAALEAVLEDVSKRNVDRIVCLGDVIGYGPDPCACLDQSMQFAFCVLGNHDSSALFDPEGFNIAAEQAIFWTRARIECGSDGPEASKRRMEFICSLPRVVLENSQDLEGSDSLFDTHVEDETAAPAKPVGLDDTDQRIEAVQQEPTATKIQSNDPDLMFVHGSPRGPTNEYVFPEDTQNVKKMEKLFSLFNHLCFQGHTHVPGVFTSDLRFIRPVDTATGYSVADKSQRLMINVGSVGQPRDGDSRSCYVIHDGETVAFHRVEYDIEKTVKAIENEPELDNLLGYRLREGR